MPWAAGQRRDLILPSAPPGMRFTATAVVLLLLAPGCLDTSPDGGAGGATAVIEAPSWEVGQAWTYTVVVSGTVEEIAVVTTMVIGDIDETDYHIGSSQLLDAQRHAVLNHNPAHGRISIADMALYEKNEPQLLLQFPLTAGASWNFSLFGSAPHIRDRSCAWKRHRSL